MEDAKDSNCIIVLDDMSGSEESISFVVEKEKTLGFEDEEVREMDALSDYSFEFPEVNFQYQKENKKPQKPQHDYDSDSAFDSRGTNLSPVFDVDLDSGCGSGSGNSYTKYTQSPEVDAILQKHRILKRTENAPVKKKSKPRTQKTIDPEKERLKAEKLKKKEEKAKEKALQALERKNLNKLKPEECMKSMKVIIDENIQNRPYFNDILATLREAELTFNLEAREIHHSISWRRQNEEDCMDEMSTRRNLQDENQMLIIWNWDEVVEKIADGTFSSTIASICDSIPSKQITLIIYGMMEYFSYRKSQRNKAVRNEILGNESKKKGNTKNDKTYGASPEISMNDLQEGLLEIQMLNCSNKIVQSAEELALVVYQFTKAIAEAPYRIQKNKNMADKVGWYAEADNRDTVRVDQDGNGLKRLWQQQLCQFNLSSLETAEAISRVYGSPMQLIEAYMQCSSSAEGEMLLRDVPIRRAAGPVTTVRKIGPELSKKIYTMFTSEDGGVLLN